MQPRNPSYSTLNDQEVEQFYTYGFAHYGNGNFSEAADTFRLLCTRRPFEAKFWFSLGATLQEAGSYQEALSAWAMVALLKPEDPYPHFHAAECCFSLQHIEDGFKALQETRVRLSYEALPHPLLGKIEVLKQQWGGLYGVCG